MTRSSSWGFTAEPEQWRLHAACAGHDPDWWTAAGQGDPSGRANNRRAIAICDRCPVAAQCLDYGTRTGSVGMIYGGQVLLTTDKRREIKCPVCGDTYVTVWRHQRYCSTRCAQRHRTARYVERKRRERAYA